MFNDLNFFHASKASWLVVSTPSEKYEFVNGKDDIPYMKWKIRNVPNHQPVSVSFHSRSTPDMLIVFPLQWISFLVKPNGSTSFGSYVQYLRKTHGLIRSQVLKVSNKTLPTSKEFFCDISCAEVTSTPWHSDLE